MADIIDLHSRSRTKDAMPPGEPPDPRGSAVPPIPLSPPAATASVPREIARSLYLRLRPRFLDPEQTVQALLRVLRERRDKIPPDAPPGDETLIRDWMQSDTWERGYERQQLLKPLDDDNRRALECVDECRIYLSKAKEALDHHLTSGPEERGEVWTKMFVSLSTQVRVWDGEVAKAEDTLRQMVLERQTEEIRAEGEAVYQDLISQYDGLGPHYNALCRRVAELHVRIEQANRSGRIVSSDEFTRMSDAYLRAVNQLQKYTETTKSESVSKETQEIVKAALRVVEDIVAPQAPQLWMKALRAVEAKIGAKPREEQAS